MPPARTYFPRAQEGRHELQIQAWLFSDRAGRHHGSGRHFSCDRSAELEQVTSFLPARQLGTSVSIRTPQHQNARGHGECRLPACLCEWRCGLHNSERLCCPSHEAVAGRCDRYKRGYNFLLAERNRERKPDPAAKFRWDVQTSSGESDR
jgi:hypothetical protein